LLKRYPYFKTPLHPDERPAPAPLCRTVEREVRFEEVDGMGVVWHGRYPSYFEDARVALGAHYGIGYDVLMRERTPAPVRQLHIEYLAPLRFGRRCRITAALHWSGAARMNTAYTVRTADDGLCASGYSVQLFTDAAGELLLEQPAFYAAFCRRWRRGDVERSDAGDAEALREDSPAHPRRGIVAKRAR
jgi:acyl-CoA thioester hydrolase